VLRRTTAAALRNRTGPIHDPAPQSATTILV
jgi:hypothetical protein